MLRRRLWTGLCLGASILIYGLASQQISSRGRNQSPAELLVSLPLFAQVALAAGDRHLAANLSGFRVLVAETPRMKQADYAVQARLQKDIAWLNPAHEDNYYIAAAILPWSGHLEAAQQILRRAVAARAKDWQPAFYLGFYHYHFLKDPAEGARWLLAGVPRATEQQDQWALENLAAQWLEKGYATATAAAMVGAMAESAPPGNFRTYLRARAKRLQDLARLRELVLTYKERQGRLPGQIEELVTAGLIAEIPADPLGIGFTLDAEGMPTFKSSRVER